MTANSNGLTKEGLTALVVKWLPGVSIITEPKEDANAIRFIWRGNRFRCTTTFLVERSEPPMLISDKEADMVKRLLREAYKATKPARLERVIIARDGQSWTVTRERAENGESGRFSNLEECFDFVRAIYDTTGEGKGEAEGEAPPTPSDQGSP